MDLLCPNCMMNFSGRCIHHHSSSSTHTIACLQLALTSTLTQAEQASAAVREADQAAGVSAAQLASRQAQEQVSKSRCPVNLSPSLLHSFIVLICMHQSLSWDRPGHCGEHRSSSLLNLTVLPTQSPSWNTESKTPDIDILGLPLLVQLMCISLHPQIRLLTPKDNVIRHPVFHH